MEERGRPPGYGLFGGPFVPQAPPQAQQQAPQLSSATRFLPPWPAQAHEAAPPQAPPPPFAHQPLGDAALAGGGVITDDGTRFVYRRGASGPGPPPQRGVIGHLPPELLSRASGSGADGGAALLRLLQGGRGGGSSGGGGGSAHPAAPQPTPQQPPPLLAGAADAAAVAFGGLRLGGAGPVASLFGAPGSGQPALRPAAPPLAQPHHAVPQALNWQQQMHAGGGGGGRYGGDAFPPQPQPQQPLQQQQPPFADGGRAGHAHLFGGAAQQPPAVAYSQHAPPPPAGGAFREPQPPALAWLMQQQQQAQQAQQTQAQQQALQQQAAAAAARVALFGAQQNTQQNSANAAALAAAQLQHAMAAVGLHPQPQQQPQQPQPPLPLPPLPQPQPQQYGAHPPLYGHAHPPPPPPRTPDFGPPSPPRAPPPRAGLGGGGGGAGSSGPASGGLLGGGDRPPPRAATSPPPPPRLNQRAFRAADSAARAADRTLAAPPPIPTSSPPPPQRALPPPSHLPPSPPPPPVQRGAHAASPQQAAHSGGGGGGGPPASLTSPAAALRRRYDPRRPFLAADPTALSAQLASFVASLQPSEADTSARRAAFGRLSSLVASEWGGAATLSVYGSLASGFGSRGSDVDACLSLAPGTHVRRPLPDSGEDDVMASPEREAAASARPPDARRDAVARVAALASSAGGYSSAHALTSARMPVAKLVDGSVGGSGGVALDVCVNNGLALANTQLLRDYAAVDARLRGLVYVVKAWAKARAVNSPYTGTLSSYCYVLMAIHTLQIRPVPVLPCLQALSPPTVDRLVEGLRCAWCADAGRLARWGERNTESPAQLLAAFFGYWAFGHDYATAVASVRVGGNLTKRRKGWTTRVGTERHLICVEDPLEVSHDLGRVVDKRTIGVLRDEFERAARILAHNPDPLPELLAPFVPPPAGVPRGAAPPAGDGSDEDDGAHATLE